MICHHSSRHPSSLIIAPIEHSVRLWLGLRRHLAAPPSSCRRPLLRPGRCGSCQVQALQPTARCSKRLQAAYGCRAARHAPL